MPRLNEREEPHLLFGKTSGIINAHTRLYDRWMCDDAPYVGVSTAKRLFVAIVEFFNDDTANIVKQIDIDLVGKIVCIDVFGCDVPEVVDEEQRAIELLPAV